MTRGLIAMAKSQENDTAILLGLEDYKVGEVRSGEEKVVVKTEVKEREKCPHWLRQGLWAWYV